jgi:DNA-binding CsgD family transcriptional regulator
VEVIILLKDLAFSDPFKLKSNTMAKSKELSWLGYIQKVSSAFKLTDDIRQKLMEKMLHLNPVHHSLFFHTVPLIYLLDYTTGKYLSVSNTSNSILGYDPKYILEAGLSFTIEKYDKQHLKLYDQAIFPDRLSLLHTIPHEEHPDYIFSYNFCIKNRKNEQVNLLQRNSFVQSSEDGSPLLSFGLVINADQYIKTNPITQVVEKIDKCAGKIPEKVFIKSYFLNEEDHLFSKRETEVLKWMAEGLTSKEIAQRLFISEATVIIHRRRLMEKAGALNVASLISFAIRRGII